MPNIARVQVSWNGTPVVGGGLSTFYFNEAATGFVADVVTFFDAIKGVFPQLLSWTIPGNGDLLDVASGQLTGTWAETGGSTVNCTGVGDYPQGVGARVRWATNGITNGRRVRGSTYLAPLLNGQFQGSNGLAEAARSLFANSGNVLVAAQSGDFLIYTQPKPGVAGKTQIVTSADCPDKVSWLRSRRT